MLALRDHLRWAIADGQELTSGYWEWRDLLDTNDPLWGQTWDVFLLRDEIYQLSELVDDYIEQHGGLETSSGEATDDLGNASLAAEFDSLSPAAQWRYAEELAESALQFFGFADAVCTPPGADGGLDVVGARVAAQVKWVARTISRPTVQQLHGAAGDRLTAFFARAGYKPRQANSRTPSTWPCLRSRSQGP
jgi:hypothetical protein